MPKSRRLQLGLNKPLFRARYVKLSPSVPVFIAEKMYLYLYNSTEKPEFQLKVERNGLTAQNFFDMMLYT